MSKLSTMMMAMTVGVAAAAVGVVGGKTAEARKEMWQWIMGSENPPKGQKDRDKEKNQSSMITTMEMRDAAGKKMKEVDAQIPIVRAHVQTLQAREVAVKYAVYAANEMLNEAKWPCTFAGVRVETRGDAYRTLVAVEDKQKKIRAELMRFTAAQSALNRVREELDDKMRTLDLVDAHTAVIDAGDFSRELEKIKVPSLPSEPSVIDLPSIDLTAVK